MRPEKEAGYRRLFKELDKNKDGSIVKKDIAHLTPSPQVFMSQSDFDNDGKVKEDEFVRFCHENEKELHKLFDSIDTKNDGVIDLQELESAFKSAGIEYTSKQLESVLTALDNKGVLEREVWVQKNLLLNTQCPTNFLEEAFVKAHDMDQSVNYMQKLRAFPGAALAKTVSAPFDRMKIFYQVYSHHYLKSSERMTLRKCLTELHSEGGVLGLFRGNGINVVKSMPEAAIKLECNKWIRHNFKNGNENLPIYKEILAGASSGLLAQSAVYPLDTLKVRIALSRTNEYKNSFDAIRQIYQEPTKRPLQICNFYRGFFSSLGVIVYVATELTAYNSLSAKFKKSCEQYNLNSAFASGASSFLAPAAGTIISYPLQLIRTKYQSDKRPKAGYLQFCQYTYQNYGFRGFFTGIVPNLFKSVISGSIILGWWSFVNKD